MTNADYQQLAQQFMQLWQQQMTQSMQDPAFLRFMLDAMEQFQQATGGEETHDTKPNRAGDRGAAVSAGAGDDALVQLERRLAACEARLAFLEAERAEKRSKKSKSGK